MTNLPYHNPKNIDPALLTLDEYSRIVNSKDKWHPDSAYDFDLERMNAYFDISDFRKVLRRFTANGIEFTVRLSAKPARYVKTGPDGFNPLRINNEVQYFSEDELKRMGYQTTQWALAIVNPENECVAKVEDEWGCVLIMVASEYRGFGFGPMLGKIARQIEPDRPSGGFTPGGYANFRKVHREFVRDALTSGHYRDLIKQGTITLDRVREIIDSAKLENHPKKPTANLSSSDPRDWLLYGIDGVFILYDRKLIDVLQNEEKQDYYWLERMIKGYLLVRIPESWEGSSRPKYLWGLSVRFGADDPSIRRLLLKMGMEWCRREKVPMAIDEADMQYLRPEDYTALGGMDKRTGMTRQLVKPLKRYNYDQMVEFEQRFRAKIDPYGEFRDRVIELAESKYD